MGLRLGEATLFNGQRPSALCMRTEHQGAEQRACEQARCHHYLHALRTAGQVVDFYAAVFGPVHFTVAKGCRLLFTVGNDFQL